MTSFIMPRMELARELEASLREFSAAATVEVRENRGRVAPLASLSWEVRGAAEKPLLHLWSAEYNLTRRVLAITDHSEQRLILAVERFGRSKPDRLEFVRMNFERSARDLTRHAFCKQPHVCLAVAGARPAIQPARKYRGFTAHFTEGRGSRCGTARLRFTSAIGSRTLRTRSRARSAGKVGSARDR